MISRRSFLKAAGLAPAILGAAADTPPNVVFFICDQMRADALGALGGRNGRTPNLDRLAGQGAVFENSYSSNPVCVPSRKSIWTSLYPHHYAHLNTEDALRFLAARDRNPFFLAVSYFDPHPPYI